LSRSKFNRKERQEKKRRGRKEKNDNLKRTNWIIIELDIKNGLLRKSAEWKCKTLRPLRKLCALCG